VADRQRCYVNEANLKTQVSRLAHRHCSRRYSKGLVYRPARARSAANARAAKDFANSAKDARPVIAEAALQYARMLIASALSKRGNADGVYLSESLTASSPA
jgi:hypothetical protein